MTDIDIEQYNINILKIREKWKPVLLEGFNTVDINRIETTLTALRYIQDHSSPS